MIMTIPDYQTVMLPLLKYCADKKEHSIREATQHIVNEFNLTEAQQLEKLPSGTQPVIDNRVGWARTYMKKAGLLEDPRRGYVRITDKGLEVLSRNPQRIDVKFLEQFPEFIEFRAIKKSTEKQTETDDKDDELEEKTPDELMEKGNNIIRASLAQELLGRLRKIDPYFFEEVVGELLTTMEYGECTVTKRSGDGGLDGIVNQDTLGIDKIFFQAKRFDENNTVSASMIRDFVGTLDLNGANKGVFITTSKFPKDATDTISKTQKNIILIDGAKLAQLMIEHDVGVATHKVYKVKKIDSDFFPED